MNEDELTPILETVREALIQAMADAYEDAGQSGLCAEGRWELALDRARSLDLNALVKERRLLATDEHR